MVAIIKQQFVHPITEQRYTRDISIDIEVVRPDNSLEIASKPYIRMDGCGDRPPPDSNFPTVFVDPEELICDALDGKRTTCPIKCMRSYLTKKSSSGDEKINIFDNGPRSLNCVVGDPIAILSDLVGTLVEYSIIKEIRGNEILLVNPLKNTFLKGAFVQNLRNRWHKQTVLGAKSFIKRPPAVDFNISKSENGEGLEVRFNNPMDHGYGVIRYLDVYVRKDRFYELEPHWIADTQDVSATSPQTVVYTHGGGADAGGGLLGPGHYYFAVVSKNAPGRVDVDESEPVVFEYTLD